MRGLEKEGYSLNIKRLKINIPTVIFQDGTMWHIGQMMRRDPAKPDSWIPINQSPSTQDNTLRNQSWPQPVKAKYAARANKFFSIRDSPRFGMAGEKKYRHLSLPKPTIVIR